MAASPAPVALNGGRDVQTVSPIAAPPDWSPALHHRAIIGDVMGPLVDVVQRGDQFYGHCYGRAIIRGRVVRPDR